LYPEALVFQEDRNLVMGGQTILDLDSDDDLDAAYAASCNHRPHPLGGFLVYRGKDPYEPLAYQAIVHDLELDPSCRPGDVRRSLCSVVQDAQERDLTSIATEPLGRWHERGISLDDMARAFDAAILELSTSVEKSIRMTLVFDELEEIEEASHLLRARILSRASRSFRTADGSVAVAEVREGDAKFHVRFVPGTLSGYLVTRSSRGH
jgi:hypothetical protein